MLRAACEKLVGDGDDASAVGADGKVEGGGEGKAFGVGVDAVQSGGDGDVVMMDS